MLKSHKTIADKKKCCNFADVYKISGIFDRHPYLDMVGDCCTIHILDISIKRNIATPCPGMGNRLGS